MKVNQFEVKYNLPILGTLSSNAEFVKIHQSFKLIKLLERSGSLSRISPIENLKNVLVLDL